LSCESAVPFSVAYIGLPYLDQFQGIYWAFRIDLPAKVGGWPVVRGVVVELTDATSFELTF
jgi:hypothetical protein